MTSASVPSPSTIALRSVACLSATSWSRSTAACSYSMVGAAPHLGSSPPGERAGACRPGSRRRPATSLAVLLGVDPADAGGRALADVAQQARSAAGARALLEDAVGAGAHREHPQQRVDRVADRPRLGVRPVVPVALALGAAADEHPRELLRPGDRHPRVGLVVAVLDVEPRVELLDPGVLQLQRLQFVADQRPFHLRGGAHHGLGAEVQACGIGEVGVEPLAQVDGLADVDHAAVASLKRYTPGSGRDGAGRRPVARRISHGHRLPPDVPHASQHRHRRRRNGARARSAIG